MADYIPITGVGGTRAANSKQCIKITMSDDWKAKDKVVQFLVHLFTRKFDEGHGHAGSVSSGNPLSPQRHILVSSTVLQDSSNVVGTWGTGRVVQIFLPTGIALDQVAFCIVTVYKEAGSGTDPAHQRFTSVWQLERIFRIFSPRPGLRR